MRFRRLVVLGFCFLCLAGCGGSDHSYAPVMERSLATGAPPKHYRVRNGDSLYSIAWAYGLDYQQLARVNHLSAPYLIHKGQLLRIKVAGGHPKPVKISTKEIKRYHWSWPAKGRILKGFSSKAFGNKGINIGGRLGSPIRAMAAGVVVYSGAGVRGYGNLLIIKHNQTYLSAYAFNKRNLVKDGMRVRRGQKIAEMGQDNSGRVMLHFEIRHNGRPINPRLFLH